MESKDEALRSQIAIRCAKVCILLYSLKAFPNRHFKTTSNGQDEDLMMEEIRDLKMKLARERIKCKRIKLCGLMEVILQVMLLLSFSTVLLVLAFKSPSN
ncbi:hypothetical protein P3X46_028700 [Hevea brasiliensis]|uniref:K-box domain-containing protein n=1 Tax=Hevea brasiliensis TaxID=3981 RepID=A0ABQ9KPV0_HEVBR|nr:uncharacterized protein LOC131168760 isoform X2 [Hevea brasiliensis]KAJ9146431.1 hypothetical protein P3X46_028700 [Hevea brasiliensis]